MGTFNIEAVKMFDRVYKRLPCIKLFKSNRARIGNCREYLAKIDKLYEKFVPDKIPAEQLPRELSDFSLEVCGLFLGAHKPIEDYQGRLADDVGKYRNQVKEFLRFLKILSTGLKDPRKKTEDSAAEKKLFAKEKAKVVAKYRALGLNDKEIKSLDNLLEHPANV